MAVGHGQHPRAAPGFAAACRAAAGAWQYSHFAIGQHRQCRRQRARAACQQRAQAAALEWTAATCGPATGLETSGDAAGAGAGAVTDGHAAAGHCVDVPADPAAVRARLLAVDHAPDHPAARAAAAPAARFPRQPGAPDRPGQQPAGGLPGRVDADQRAAAWPARHHGALCPQRHGSGSCVVTRRTALSHGCTEGAVGGDRRQRAHRRPLRPDPAAHGRLHARPGTGAAGAGGDHLGNADVGLAPTSSSPCCTSPSATRSC
ncbi:hypothetical protein G6F68_010294 [Rhizopus microsporus]|nr:hypothetical protein G6F68_010294 [Rhizopus microsporus]